MLLELLLIIANIGTAVVLFPILRRQNETLALGYVTARLVESIFIAIGILSVLAIVTLQQDAANAGSGSLAVVLAAIKDWTFLLGPGFIVGIGNGLLLGYLMYRSGLVPRRLAMLGLIGGPLICASGIAVLFGVAQAGGALQVVATIPEFLWELSLGIYLIVKGFRPCPILTGSAERVTVGRSARSRCSPHEPPQPRGRGAPGARRDLRRQLGVRQRPSPDRGAGSGVARARGPAALAAATSSTASVNPRCGWTWLARAQTPDPMLVVRGTTYW